MTPVLFIPRLRYKERRRLENHLHRTRDARHADRLRAVLWSEQGQSTTQMARLLGKHSTTVQRWLHDYLRFGVRGLQPGRSPGRPRLLDADGEECLRQAVLTQPRDLGYRFTRWSAAMLAEHLHRAVHVRVSPFTVCRALHRLRFSYKRPKLSLRHRQNRRAVRWAAAQREAALKKGTGTPTGTSSSLKTSASSISIPA